jgi:multiple antibiotic resistance protein
MEWAFLGSVFITLLVIIDPPGIIPIFLGLTAGRSRADVARLALQAMLTSLGVITGFAVLGDKVLAYLHISLPAMQGAGGLLLLLVALELLTGKTAQPEAHDDVSIALVPLGVPLLAGPGAIVATILFARDATTVPEMLALAAAILLVHALLWAAMRYSVVIARVLGQGGITVLTRISGVLLAAIAVQLVADAVRGFVMAG